MASAIGAHEKRDYHLREPEDFLYLFDRRPIDVMERVLDLLNNDPVLAKEVLVNLADYYHKNPKAFFQHTETSRTALQAHLTDLSKRALLTKEQWNLKEQIEMGEFPEESSKESTEKPPKKLSEWRRLESIRENKKNLEAAEAKRKELWDRFLVGLDQNNELEDLSFAESDERSFERVVEAMFFFRSVHSLHSKEIFSRNFALIRELFALVSADGYPVVNRLLEKARQILLKENSEEILRNIFVRAFPLPQKSAPLRWLDRLFYSL